MTKQIVIRINNGAGGRVIMSFLEHVVVKKNTGIQNEFRKSDYY